jgi:protein-L-isoaspartate(D-aspartate) O-methyltransferase
VSVELTYDDRWSDRLKEAWRAGAKIAGDVVELSRSQNPVEWQKLVDTDDAITTRIKDGRWPSSSSSAPWLMAKMIRALDLRPGMKVLEIGTGTGFNAACLAALGAQVVSIEFQEDVAGNARRNLEKAGHSEVKVIAGDGSRGSPGDAPFDRVIATAAVHTVPYPWVAQTRNGGLLVVPYTGESHSAALLVLTVCDGVASGGMEGTASFMPLSGQGLSQARLRAIVDHPGLRVRVGPEGQSVTTG